MASLENVAVKDSYTSLLKLNGNTDSLVAGNGSNAIQVVDGNGDASPLYLNTDRLGIGGQPSYRLSIEGTDATTSTVSVRRNANGDRGSFLNFRKSRGTSVGSSTIVNNNDYIGEILFYGSDGTNDIEAGAIKCYVNGAPGSNDMPGALEFRTTADGASSSSSRMTINSAGNVGIGMSPDMPLNVRVNTDEVLRVRSDSGVQLTARTDNNGSDVALKLRASSFSFQGGAFMELDANSRISLSNNDVNTDNTVFGYNAFTNNGTVLGNINADRNTVFGNKAMGTGTTTAGVNNVAIGHTALEDHISADSCVAIGAFALANVTSGIRNLGIGTESGAIVTTGADNISIGTSSNLTSSSASNQIVIGVSATAQGDNTVTLGNASVTDVYMSQDSQAYVHSQNVPNHVANTMSSPYYRFDGADDKIASSETFQTTFRNSFSISALVKFEDGRPSAINTIFGVYDTTSGTEWIQFALLTTGALRFTFHINSNSATFDSSVVFEDGETGWNHIVAVANESSDTIGIYLNGKSLGTASTPSHVWTDYTSSKPPWIGARNTNDIWSEGIQGSIQNLKVWNKYLTATEVKDDYSGASVPFKYKGANQTNMLTNPNFDSNTSSWSAQYSSLSSDSGGQSGNCLTVTRSSHTNQSAYQDITTVVGKRYMFSAYVKSGTSGNESFDIVLHNPNGTAFNYTNATSSGSWVQYSVEFTATGTTTQAKLRKNTSTAGTMLFDTCNVVPIGAVAEFDGSSAGSKVWGDKSGNDLHGTVGAGTLDATAPTLENTPYDSGTEYEEGTFTPSLGGNTSYNAQVGNYTKIGRKVTCIMSLNINAIGTGSTHTISGLPYPSMNATEASGCVGFFSGSANTVSTINPSVNNDASTVTLCSVGGSGATATATSTAIFANSTSIRINVTYFTD